MKLSLELRFLADENIPYTVISELKKLGYNIISVLNYRSGMTDEEVIELAVKEKRIIITFDKDFGRLVTLNPNTPGVILLRIPPINPEYILKRIQATLKKVQNPYKKLIIVRKKTIKIIKLSINQQ